MSTIRIPRGHEAVRWPFLKVFEPGHSPSYKCYAARFLPIAAVDRVHEDPYVLLPGTFVGRLDNTVHAAVDSSFRDRGDIVPACPNAYTVTYSAYDVEFGTPDLDADKDTVVTAAGASTATVAATLPLGIVMGPIYASWMVERYTNYQRNLISGWKSRDCIVRIPCITANEKLVKLNDQVMLDDTASPSYNPQDLANSLPGRIMTWDGTLANTPYIVGKCVGKHLLGKQVTPTAGQTLQAALVGAPRAPANFDLDYQYDGVSIDFADEWRAALNAVTPLNSGLAGGQQTLGRSGDLLYARADGSGDFWAIDIEVNIR